MKFVLKQSIINAYLGRDTTSAVSQLQWSQSLKNILKNTVKLQSWTKVLGNFCVSGAFSNSHRSKPSPRPKNDAGRLYPEFFPSFNFVQGGGRERTARIFRKGCTVLRGNREMTEKYEYCSTVPRTFVQDCRYDF